jgi:hypothetical protein
MDPAGRYDGGVILALDAATRTGVCEGIPGDTPRLEAVNFGTTGKGDEFDLWAAAQRFAARRLDAPVRLLILEGLVPQYDKTLQCGIYGIIGAVARIRNIPILTVMPQSWRATVLGDGKLNRAKAKARALWLCGQLGWKPQTDDDAEAACIWLWGCMQVAPRFAPQLPLFMRSAS